MEIYTKVFVMMFCISLHDSLSYLYYSMYKNTKGLKNIILISFLKYIVNMNVIF